MVSVFYRPFAYVFSMKRSQKNNVFLLSHESRMGMLAANPASYAQIDCQFMLPDFKTYIFCIFF